jgi:hypothetical protein
LVFKIAHLENHTIYRFEDNSIEVAGHITVNDIKKNGWVVVSSIQISEIGKPFVILTIPTNERLSQFTKFSNKI